MSDSVNWNAFENNEISLSFIGMMCERMLAINRDLIEKESSLDAAKVSYLDSMRYFEIYPSYADSKDGNVTSNTDLFLVWRDVMCKCLVLRLVKVYTFIQLGSIERKWS